jgi:hypothetical protein
MLNQLRTCPAKLSGGGAAGGLRGIIEIALYGHCVAQSPQPMQVFGSISICPSLKRQSLRLDNPSDILGLDSAYTQRATRRAESGQYETLQALFYRSFDVYAAPQKTRLPVHVVTGK